MEKEKIINGIRRYFLFFVMYSMVGWIYEVFLEVVIYRWGFSDRGVLFGPYLPIYGFGGVIFILLFLKLSKRRTPSWFKFAAVPIVFLGCAVVATSIELLTSYMLEYFTGAWPWQTYVDYAINFQGRIALSPSIRFGLGGIVFVYMLQPLYEKILKKFSGRKLVITSNLIFTIVIIDLILTMVVKFFY